MTPILTAEQLTAMLEREFPQLFADTRPFDIINIGPGTATLRMVPTESQLRPGGTISGPSLFALADVAAWVAILAHVGEAIGTVTVNLSINFRHRPDPVPVDGIARILKLGRKLAFLEISIERSDNRDMVAHATATYSIPSKKNVVK